MNDESQTPSHDVMPDTAPKVVKDYANRAALPQEVKDALDVLEAYSDKNGERLDTVVVILDSESQGTLLAASASPFHLTLAALALQNQVTEQTGLPFELSVVLAARSVWEGKEGAE